MSMSSTQTRRRDYRVTTTDGTAITYSLSGLSESEVARWAAFCASVFSYKANPPSSSYFLRHYINDPNREASFIRVAFDGEQIVASCRVFRRKISRGKGEYLQAGGIGEVCTDAGHRKRGLSAQLLKDAIEIVTDHGMEVSFLHAAPDFFPVYEKAGYISTTTKWSVATIDRSVLIGSMNDDSAAAVRLAQFPKDTETLMALHQRLSEHRFTGCICRSALYWNEYIRKELEGALYIFEQDDAIVAWLSVQSRGLNKLRVRDYGCVDNIVQGYEVLGMLLNRAIRGLPTESQFQLLVPTFILDEVQAAFKSRNLKDTYVDWSATIIDDDRGWMYKQIGDSGLSMPDLSIVIPHLIWPADSF